MSLYRDEKQTGMYGCETIHLTSSLSIQMASTYLLSMPGLISCDPPTSRERLYQHKWRGLDVGPKVLIYLTGLRPQIVITQELCIISAPGDDITIAGWNISSDMASWLCGAARAFIKNSISLIKRLELDSCFLIAWGLCGGFIIWKKKIKGLQYLFVCSLLPFAV